MCNLYRMDAPVRDVTKMFGVEAPEGLNAAEEIYPGYPGLVSDGQQVGQMTWGFPLVRKGKQGQPLKPKPVNNTRTDKLKSPFWRSSFENRRCLIPTTRFAEAEGPRGKMTRTWFSHPDGELLFAAGIWRDSAEFGKCYSMLMTDANEAVAPVHDRMPVLLVEKDWNTWLSGDPGHAYDLCKPFAGELAVDRTDTLWVRKS